MKKRFLSMLALLLMVAAGAWADESSESFTTTSRATSYTGEHFKISLDKGGDDDGFILKESAYARIEALNGEIITKVEFTCGLNSISDLRSAVGTITLDGVVAATVSGVNATSLAVNAVDELQIKAVKVYYGDPAPATYSITLDEGTGNKDSQNWEITPKSSELGGGEAVTVKYNGSREVKSVTVVKKAAAAKPDLLSSVFSVSASKKVTFSKGNLRYASSKWSFFDNQYDYYTSYSDDAWDKFGWSTSATTYGMNTSNTNDDYSGDFVDWGATMGTGWSTLSSDEWTYLFNTRSASTVNGTENGRYAKAKVNDVPGVILFPDTYTHPDGVTAPTGVNATDDTGWNGNSYTVADWTKMESAGCVFLPAAGYRGGSSVNAAGSVGRYWSATPNGTGTYGVYFYSSSLTPANNGSRRLGLSVRLVQAVDAPAPLDNTFLDWNGTQLVATAMPTTYNTVESASTDVNWEGGTYVVEGDVTINGKIELSGSVNLIIKDGAKLTVNGYINGNSNKLYIYGQAQMTGQLVVNCSNNHAINGLTTLEVHSAEVTATGSGNGKYGGINSDKFNVYGGLVDAKSTATDGGYGISLSGGGSMDIYGGEVKAVGKGTGGWDCGIVCGSFDKAPVTVHGGKLWAENTDRQALNYINLHKGDGFTGKIETSDDNEYWDEYDIAGSLDHKYVRVGY